MKILGILCFVLALAGAVRAAGPPSSERLVPELSPMMVEIQAVLETARLEVADLKLEYDAATTDREAMDLAHRIAQVKRESRVEMLRIQLRYARAENREETAAQLENAIMRLTTPAAGGVPQARQPRHQ